MRVYISKQPRVFIISLNRAPFGTSIEAFIEYWIRKNTIERYPTYDNNKKNTIIGIKLN